MTSTPAASRVLAAPETGSRLAVGLHAALLTVGFVVVHLWLSWAVLHGPHTPLNDVSTVYRNWVADGRSGLGWVGLTTVWVYPTLALVPMQIAAVFGFGAYSITWLVLVALLDAAAVAVLTRGGTRRVGLAWWWLLFLVLLGPIAVGRIDTVTVPIALVGLLVAERAPAAGSILLTIACWVKVWPVGLLLALAVVSKRRLSVVIAAAATSVAVLLGAALAGGTAAAVLGFVTQQTGRGLQLEAPVTTFWLWLEVAKVPGVETVFDHQILTYQVSGPGSLVVSALMTPIMAVVVLGLALLGVWSLRRGVPRTTVGVWLGLALTATLVATNKVGSPQYETWLAVPVLAGLVVLGRRFALPAVLAAVVAALTQLVYPWNYDLLVESHPVIVAVISLRNLLLVALVVVAALGIVRQPVPGRSGRMKA